MNILTLQYTLATINEAAMQLWIAIAPYRVVTLSGGLGAGKTTLVSHLCAGLQITDAVSSPTFALVNEYRLTTNGKEAPFYHIDWYRLKDAAEGADAGMEDYIEEAQRGAAWCIIEWPEQAAPLLIKPYVAVTIKVTGEEEREMTAVLVS